MVEDWLLLIERYGLEGARAKFESICADLYKAIYRENQYVKEVRVSQGDGGIDIFIGNIGNEPIHIIQCKFFYPEFGDSQKDQVRKSFQRVISSDDFKVKSWTLCIANKFSIPQHKWWITWRDRESKECGIAQNDIKLKNGEDLIFLIKENNLYDILFEKQNNIILKRIHDEIVKYDSIHEVKNTLRKSSASLMQIRNFIGNNSELHIPRLEVNKIYDWISSDLENDNKNTLILVGEKGIGKSSVLKEVYDLLSESKDYLVLGIKADKFYKTNIDELEKNIFLDDLTFNRLFKLALRENKKLVLLIDQIDALSHSITSNREYINTYNRLISEFTNENNIRIVLSTRIYDLEYDADLSIYNSSSYMKVRLIPFEKDEVEKILQKLKITCNSDQFIELLRIPNHLDIFCSLPNKNKISYDTVSSIKDLYDEMWKQYISSKKNTKLKELIYMIVQKMYLDGISIKNIYSDSYIEELSYLKSCNIIIEQDQYIQFFHQTFYEYCFAKQFVENESSLTTYINDNNESLYVRSVIKMVVEYLRDFDSKKYISTLEEILLSKNYRSHIKILMLGILSIQEKPNEIEKIFLLDNILCDEFLEEVFINSINSREWVEFLIEEDIPKKYLDTSKRMLLWSILSRKINTTPFQILTYTDNLDFTEKESFMGNLIHIVDNWKDERLLDFFTKYIKLQEIKTNNGGMHNIWYFELLGKIYQYHPDYVYEKLRSPLLNSLKNNNHTLEYRLDDLLEELSKINPNAIFTYLYDILTEATSGTNSRPYLIYYNNEIPSELYKGKSFTSLYSDINNSEKTVNGHLRHLVKNVDLIFFKSLFQARKKTNNIHELNIINVGLECRSNLMVQEIIEIIKIIDHKNGFKSCDDELQLSFRRLLPLIYDQLDKEQKKYIKYLLLNMTSQCDSFISPIHGNTKKRYSLRNFGRKKFAFILALPQKAIDNDSEIKASYQMLERKFGNIDYKKVLDGSSSQGGIVGPPLDYDVYSKMSIESWKISMYKFNENYRSKVFLKGGLEEHAVQFRETVKCNPKRFYTFIESLFNDGNINIRYLNSGISGLIEGKYNPEKVKILFKKFINLNLDNEYILYTTWNIEYFINSNTIDDTIVEYLITIANQERFIEKDLGNHDLFSDGLNSIIGSAISRIMSLYENKTYENLIFETIEQNIKNKLCSLSVKAVILRYLAYLNHLNIDRAYQIFKILVNTNNSELLKSSIQTGQYFNESYHNDMEDYITLLMNCPETHKLNYILISSYLNELTFGLKYYKQFVNKSIDSKLCAMHVAEKNLIINKHVNQRALSILFDFLDESEKEIAREYSAIILRKFKVENFNELFDFINVYSKSKVCKIDSHYFINFLIECVKYYPEECLILLENMNLTKDQDTYEYQFYNKEPIQLVLSIYSKLVSKLRKDKMQISRCLDLFDGMLTLPHLRNNANNAIELLTK
ncbi:AAA family ATPase [Elizabethkingia anophelis]|nr:AAA family ATPase [Elizabethkingia anophelis]